MHPFCRQALASRTVNVNFHSPAEDQSKRNLNCNYTFLIDFAPNGVQFGARSIRKVYYIPKSV